jgi:hypothetical protein
MAVGSRFHFAQRGDKHLRPPFWVSFSIHNIIITILVLYCEEPSLVEGNG